MGRMTGAADGADGVGPHRGTIALIRRHPQILGPLTFAWMSAGGLVVAGVRGIPWEASALLRGVWHAFLLFWGVNLCAFLGCAAMLEMLRSVEEGAPPRPAAAAGRILRGALPVLPLAAFLWSVSWGFVSLLSILMHRRRRWSFLHDEMVGGTPPWVRETGCRIRMRTFLPLTMVVWEGRPLFDAMGKGLRRCQRHLLEYADAFGPDFGTLLLMAVPFLPLLRWPSRVLAEWMLALSVAVWVFVLFVEQVVMAELYLWIIRYEAMFPDPRERLAHPLRSVPPPSLLDSIPEFRVRDAGDGAEGPG